MKRCRKSPEKHHRERTQQESVEEEDASIGGGSISDVPIPILQDILSRLSVKSIFRCRCVCKLWFNLLLHSDFAKLHFSRAPTCPLLRDSSERRISRALHLVETLENDISICNVCDKSSNFIKFHCGCDRSVNLKLTTTFMLPKRQSTMVGERRFDIVNSCNGFLCLRASTLHNNNNYPIIIIVIYNPVTREYSVLPKPPEEDEDDESTIYQLLDVGGLGFCHKTNQYKVLVMFSKWIVSPNNTRQQSRIKVVLIYTLGSGSWRRIGDPPAFNGGISRPAFLNGALHWFVEDYSRLSFILAFDFVGEQFRALPSPCLPSACLLSRVSMGITRGFLYVCEASVYCIEIWVMKEYGVRKSWINPYSVDTRTGRRRLLGSWASPAAYHNRDLLYNDSLLMCNDRNDFISYDIDILRYLKTRKTRKTRPKFQVIAHIPTFASLKDITGDDMAVLHVR